MRKIGLDVVRGIAVILVLFRHSDLENNVIKHFGWLGVDLFFVLSGFLISSILFVEYKKNNSIRVFRFLIRRAFKIFPPFYFFMFITLFIGWITDSLNFEWPLFLAEFFYVQSYFPGIWLHTWTLAVEEQFYLVFPLTLFLITRNQLIEKRHVIISALILLLILSFTMRFYISYPHRYENSFGFMQTHLRADGILAGILLAYLLNFTKIFKVFRDESILNYMPHNFMIFSVSIYLSLYIIAIITTDQTLTSVKKDLYKTYPEVFLTTE